MLTPRLRDGVAAPQLYVVSLSVYIINLFLRAIIATRILFFPPRGVELRRDDKTGRAPMGQMIVGYILALLEPVAGSWVLSKTLTPAQPLTKDQLEELQKKLQGANTAKNQAMAQITALKSVEAGGTAYASDPIYSDEVGWGNWEELNGETLSTEQQRLLKALAANVKAGVKLAGEEANVARREAKLAEGMVALARIKAKVSVQDSLLDLEIRQVESYELVQFVMATCEDLPEFGLAIWFIQLGGLQSAPASDVGLFVTSLLISAFHSSKCIWAFHKLRQLMAQARGSQGAELSGSEAAFTLPPSTSRDDIVDRELGRGKPAGLFKIVEKSPGKSWELSVVKRSGDDADTHEVAHFLLEMSAHGNIEIKGRPVGDGIMPCISIFGAVKYMQKKVDPDVGIRLMGDDEIQTEAAEQVELRRLHVADKLELQQVILGDTSEAFKLNPYFTEHPVYADKDVARLPSGDDPKVLRKDYDKETKSLSDRRRELKEEESQIEDEARVIGFDFVLQKLETLRKADAADKVKINLALMQDVSLEVDFIQIEGTSKEAKDAEKIKNRLGEHIRTVRANPYMSRSEIDAMEADLRELMAEFRLEHMQENLLSGLEESEALAPRFIPAHIGSEDIKSDFLGPGTPAGSFNIQYKGGGYILSVVQGSSEVSGDSLDYYSPLYEDNLTDRVVHIAIEKSNRGRMEIGGRQIGDGFTPITSIHGAVKYMQNNVDPDVKTKLYDYEAELWPDDYGDPNYIPISEYGDY